MLARVSTIAPHRTAPTHTARLTTQHRSNALAPKPIPRARLHSQALSEQPHITARLANSEIFPKQGELLQKIQAHLKPARNATEEAMLLRELTHFLALYGMHQIHAFSDQAAVLSGETNLRYVHGLDRRVEFLEFTRKNPVPFAWLFHPYFEQMKVVFRAFGLGFKSQTHATPATATIRSGEIHINNWPAFADLRYSPPGLQIQVFAQSESNPPVDQVFVEGKLQFPYEFPVVGEDLTTSFNKILWSVIARHHLRGKDWYDLVWFVNKHPNLAPNWSLLDDYFNKSGPWERQTQHVTKKWLLRTLNEKITSLHAREWEMNEQELAPLLIPGQSQNIEWNPAFFNKVLKKLDGQLAPRPRKLD